jgi:hypothetical protein
MKSKLFGIIAVGILLLFFNLNVFSANFPWREMNVTNNIVTWHLHQSIPEDGCPGDSELTRPVRFSYCDPGRGDILEDREIEILYDVEFPPHDGGDPSYVDSLWPIYDLPFVHLGSHDYDDADAEHPYLGSIHDFGDTIEFWGYHNDAIVLGQINDNLQEMVNAVRLEYSGLPVIPAGYVVKSWADVEGQAVSGAQIIHENVYCYYIRYPISAADNTVSPTDDIHRTRYRDFNGGPATIPAISSDGIKFSRSFRRQLDGVGSSHVHINFNESALRAQNTIFLFPGDDVTLAELERIKINTLCYADRTSGDAGTARLIAKVIGNATLGSERQPGRQITFDVSWRQGQFQNNDTVRLGFELNEVD